MKRIPSFCVDHTRLERGVYLSRQDDDIKTWDVRMKRPNQGDYVAVPALHTIEHLFATYARNSEWQDGVIYIGPMGCRTGMYFLTRGLSDDQVLDCVRESYRFMANYEGEVPGTKPEECGNYREHDLAGCRKEAAAFLEVLEELKPENMQYKYYLE